jgi:hypothetical protein
MICLPNNHKGDHIYQARLTKGLAPGPIFFEGKCSEKRFVTAENIVFELDIKIDNLTYSAVTSTSGIFGILIGMVITAGNNPDTIMTNIELAEKIRSADSGPVCLHLLSSVLNKRYRSGSGDLSMIVRNSGTNSI